MPIKLFLDDVRDCPIGYVPSETAWDCIDHLERGDVFQLSLDHDLGDPKNGTGMDVVNWIEERVVNEEFYAVPTMIRIHSANPVGRANMERGLNAINRMMDDMGLKGMIWY